MGDAQAFSYELCQSIKAILAEDGEKPEWSDRTIAAIEGIRQDYHWLDNASTVCLPGRNGEFEWWTFGGRRANATLGNALAIELGTPTIATNFMIKFDSTVQLEMLNDALEAKGACKKICVTGCNGFYLNPKEQPNGTQEERS